jgi:tricorn protease-like protein
MAGWRYAWTADGQNLAYRVRWEDSSALAGMVSGVDGKSQSQVTDWQNDLFPPTTGKDGVTFKAGDDILTVDEKGNVKSVKSVSDGQGIVSRVAGVSAAFCASNLTGGTLSAFAALVPSAFGKPGSKDVMTNAENELWVVDENGEPKKLLDIDGEPGYFSPQTSPDGEAIAAPGLSGNLDIADRAGGYVSLGMGQNPAWSADGRYLLYEMVRDNGHDITGSDLWVCSRDGKWKQQLTSTDGIERYPNWSPDGKSIVYEMDGKIYTAPLE